MPIRAVVGLGNPGQKYERTRHNIGRRVIDALLGSKADLPGISLVKLDVFMNVSGTPVAELMRKKGIAPEDLMVISDDFELPLGRLRLRKGGSSGGHNGLKSIFEALGTQEIPRLRVGIGPVPEGQDPAEFVLERFSSREAAASEAAVRKAAEAVCRVVLAGFEAAMNEFNKKDSAGVSEAGSQADEGN